MDLLKTTNILLTILMGLCYLPMLVYVIGALMSHEENKKEYPQNRCYGLLVCARNEEKVIASLLESIDKQTYPRQLLDVFVMADNCDDDTAVIAKKHGAFVYERHDENKIGKGYALDLLCKRIKEEHDDYDGFFVFDADNILKENCIAKMHEKISEGKQIITSYRSSKNISSGVVAGCQSLWFFLTDRFLNYPRDLLGISCTVSGTGFYFSHRIFEMMNGWPYHSLSEDIEFSLDMVLKGERITYCHEAIFYDEQPLTYAQSHLQRLRWDKGYLQVIGLYWQAILKGIGHGDLNVLELTRILLPALFTPLCFVMTMLLWLSGQNDLIHILTKASFSYLALFVMAAMTVVCESKRIRCSLNKKIIYCLCFPLFMASYLIISLQALFVKVTWKPIRHEVCSLDPLS